MLQPEVFHERLGETLTLRVLRGDELLFSSDKHWLHPLFDLQVHQTEHRDIPWEEALLLDRVTGRAAAFLLADLGITRIWTRTLSRRAIPVLETSGISFDAVEVVDRIACSTEDTFLAITDLEIARREIEKLKQRVQQRSQ